MDDGGQKLRDIIDDPQFLEKILQSFSSSNLDESFNGSASADAGLVNSGLDSLVVDGQFVDPLRGGSSHPSHHVRQPVLHSPSLPGPSSLSTGATHHLHQLHSQAHSLQTSGLSQHISQHHSNHSSLSSISGNIEQDCRDSCTNRNDVDHHSLQQLLASSPINSTPQILQLQPSQSHPSHLHPPTQVPQAQTHPHHLQHHSQSSTSTTHVPSSIGQHAAQLPSVTVSPSLTHALSPSTSSSSSIARSAVLHQPQHQHLQQQSTVPQKSQNQALSTSDITSGLLPASLPSTSVAACHTRIAPLQSPPSQSNNQASITSQDNSQVPSKTTTTIISSVPLTKAVSVTAPTSILHPGRVQFVGGANQVLPSGAQLLAPGTSLLPGVQIVHPTGSTPLLSSGSILPGGQVISVSGVLPGGQGLSNASSGQVLASTTHVITTTTGITTPVTSIYVSPSVASHVNSSVPLIQQNQVLQPLHVASTTSVIPSSIASTVTISGSHSVGTPQSSSSFTVPNKSPVSLLPRTSPVSYSATPSPHPTAPSPSYPTRSPAPSPHSQGSTLCSPAPPTPSPTVTSSQIPSSVVTSPCPQGNNFVPGMVGMVQGLLPQLPVSPLGGTNGVVLTQGGNPVQVNPGIKQMVSGTQFIQLLSSPQTNQPRQQIAHPPPKPIQPKQPQLLPKLAPQATVRQPTPPPPGKTLIGARPTPPNNQQPIMFGAGQPTLIASQQNPGSLLLNSLSQPSPQQPILMNANGVLFLVRPPAVPPVAATQGQVVLVPVPHGQPQVEAPATKPPQTFVISGGGLLPQGLPQTIAGGNVFSAAQGARTPQPLIRISAPQAAPIPLQQSATPNAPMLVVTPVGHTLNIPGVFPSGTRALAPQVQLGPSITPTSAVGMGGIQLLGATLQVSSSHSAHMATPGTLPAVINTTAGTCKPVSHENAHHATTTAPLVSLSVPLQTPTEHKSSKKKNKKKKKDEDREREKEKGTSIDLDEVMKQTGIFSDIICDESEFGGLAMECNDTTNIVSNPSDAIITTSVPSIPTVLNTATTPSLSTQPSFSIQTTRVVPNIVMQSPASISSNSNPNLPNPVSSLPAGMRITFDTQGKLILGPTTDIGKSILTPVASSLSTQPGASLQVISSENFASATTPSIVSQESTGASRISHSENNSASFLRIDVPTSLSSKSIYPKAQLGNEISKVAQNTEMLHHSLDKTQLPNAPSIINTLLSGPSVSHSGAALPVPVSIQLVASDNNIQNHTEIKSATSIPTTHSSQVPVSSSAVIVTANLANSFIPGAMVNSKVVNISQSCELNSRTTCSSQTIPTTSINSSLVKKDTLNNSSIPFSMHVIDSTIKNSTYQSQYLANIKNQTLVEASKKKSNKKKKKDKEAAPIVVVSSTDHLQDRNKNITILNPACSTASNQFQFNTPVLLANGGVNSVLNSSNIAKCDTDVNKPDASVILSANHISSSVSSSIPITVITTASPISPSFASSIGTPVSSTSIITSNSKITSPNNNPNVASSVPGSFVLAGQQVLFQPSGHSVAQFVISPQNSEALKRVCNQIQTLQSKKGPLTEQDKLLHQKLLSESKILTTAKPLNQVQQNALTPQRSPVKYSHSVGHKKILFTPPSAQKKVSSNLAHNKEHKHCDYSKQELKQKDYITKSSSDMPLLTGGIASSQMTTAITSVGTMTTTITTTPFLSVAALSSVQSNSSLRPLISPTKAIDISKPESGSSMPSIIGGISSVPDIPSVVTRASNANNMPNGNFPAVSIIISAPKSVNASTSVSPIFSTSVSPSRPSAIPQASSGSGVHLSTSNSHPLQPSQNSPIVIAPHQSSPNQPLVSSHSQDHHTNLSSPSQNSQHASFSLPLTRDHLFEHQLRTDQNGSLNPDYKTPFKNKVDACKRLIRYHVFNDSGPSANEFYENDCQFENQSEILMRKFNYMENKYKSLLLKESMRRHPSSENVMLYRLFNQEERNNFEREKNDIRSGKVFKYSKDPSAWITNEDPLPEFSYSWEENWENDKVFIVNPKTSHLEEIGEENEEEEVQMHLEEEVGEWEEEELDEGQDEPRLQILEEEEEVVAEEADDTKHSNTDLSEDYSSYERTNNDLLSVKCFSSCDSDSVSYVQSPINEVFVNEQSNRILMQERTNSCYKRDDFSNEGNKEKSFNKLYCGTKENGINTMGQQPFFPGFENSNRKYNLYSKEYNNECNEDYANKDIEKDRNKWDKKYRADKEKRKLEKLKNKKDLNKSSKKLKIKLKHEDSKSAVVPPLRIRTDDRGGGTGGLKLTLKKQEGSGDYYRVGEELGRRGYKVKEDKEECSMVLNEQDTESIINHHTKISPLFPNSIPNEWKRKKEMDEFKSSKKSKKIRGNFGANNEILFNNSIPLQVCEKYGATSENDERWPRQSGGGGDASSAFSSNTFFYQTSPPPPFSSGNSSSHSFIPYTAQNQPRKNSHFS